MSFVRCARMRARKQEIRSLSWYTVLVSSVPLSFSSLANRYHRRSFDPFPFWTTFANAVRSHSWNIAEDRGTDVHLTVERKRSAHVP